MRLTTDEKTFLAGMVQHHQRELMDTLDVAADQKDYGALRDASMQLATVETIYRKLTQTKKQAD